MWTYEEPTRFDDRRALLDFLETACLREHLGTLPESRRPAFVEAVAANLPEPVIDFVRLNIVARRA